MKSDKKEKLCKISRYLDILPTTNKKHIPQKKKREYLHRKVVGMLHSWPNNEW